MGIFIAMRVEMQQKFYSFSMIHIVPQKSIFVPKTSCCFSFKNVQHYEAFDPILHLIKDFHGLNENIYREGSISFAANLLQLT